jgi:hypothetical protein
VSLEPLAQYGVIGLMLALCLLALRQLHVEHKDDREKREAECRAERERLQAQIAAESSARIEDAKDGMQVLMAMQKGLLDATDKLADLHEATKNGPRRE